MNVYILEKIEELIVAIPNNMERDFADLALTEI